MDYEKWDARFLALAEHIADWSHDPSTKVGAVLSDNKDLLSTGYNGPPAQIPDDWAFENRDNKIACTVHAEVNAIMRASKTINKSNLTLYVTHPPCPACASYIIASNIPRVVYRDSEKMRPRWNCDISDKIFELAKVSVVKM